MEEERTQYGVDALGIRRRENEMEISREAVRQTTVLKEVGQEEPEIDYWADLEFED